MVNQDPDKEPILASQASRDANIRYLTTGDPAHEILADAIYRAEQRGVNATLAALNARISLEHPEVVVPHSQYTSTELQEQINKELGR